MTAPRIVPHHVAIVMDGNGRWATRRYLPRVAGHKKGVDALRACVRHCGDIGVKVLTVFAFSSENWNRPPEEVSGLMELLAVALSREVPQLQSEGVRIHFVGDRSTLSDKVRHGLAHAEAVSAGNARLVLNICFNYGGRWDVAQAAAGLAARGEAITEQSLDRAMALAHVPDPDLLIRTGGRCASATSCSGRRRTASCTSPTSCGRSSTPPRSTRRSPTTAGASAASAAPPSRCRLPRRV